MSNLIRLFGLAPLVLAGACTHPGDSSRLEADAATTREFAPVRVEFVSGDASPGKSDYAAVIARDGKAFVRWRDAKNGDACYRVTLASDDVFPVFSEIEALDPLNAERLPPRDAAPGEGTMALAVHNAKNKCLWIPTLTEDEHRTAWGHNVVQKVEWLVVKATAKANAIDCKAAPEKEPDGTNCIKMQAPALVAAYVNHY